MRIWIAVVLAIIVASGAAFAQAPGGPPLASASQYAPGRVLVKVRPTAEAAKEGAASVNAVASTLSATLASTPSLAGAKVDRVLPVPGWASVSLPAGASVDSAAAALQSQPGIAWAEPDYYVHTLLARPNDYYYWDSTISALRIYHDDWTGFGDEIFWPYMWNMDMIQAYEGWQIFPNQYWTSANKPSDAIRVAVIDSGVDPYHPDFMNAGGTSADIANGGQLDYSLGCRVSGGVITNGPAAFMDENGHGTHVAGIIAAAGNNNSGVIGVGYNACVVPIGIIDASGSGLDSDLAIGMIYAADAGIPIMNISAGSTSYSNVIADAVNYAYYKGCLIIAAGNESGSGGGDLGRIYPGANSKVLCVSPTGMFDDFPGGGPESGGYAGYGDYIGISAPSGSMVYFPIDFGDDNWIDFPELTPIWSTVPTYPVSLGDAWGFPFLNDYAHLFGTSMATPHVSGLAALYSAYKGLDVNTRGGNLATWRAIQRGSDTPGGGPDIGYSYMYGWGRINVPNTLQDLEIKGSIYGSISGQVFKDSFPQPATTIQVRTLGGTIVGSTNTLEYGFYRITNIPPGTYIVKTVVPPALVKELKNVQVVAGCDTPGADFYLGIPDYQMDVTPPMTPEINENLTGPNQLHAKWWAVDPESGIYQYETAIGTTPGGTEVQGWTNQGWLIENTFDITAAGGAPCYASVRATNGAGLLSSVVTAAPGDTTPPTVTIDQASGQSDPTGSSPINFTVVFSESVNDFATGDVSLSGTAGAATATVTGSGTTYNVAVTGMTTDGTLLASVAAGVAHDAAGNPNITSTSTDNTVAYDATPPTVTISAPSASTTAVGPVSYTVTYADAGGIGSIGLVPGNVTLNKTGNANGAVAVTGTGNTRTVTISNISGKGTLGISVAAGTASDTAGNLAPGAGPSTTFNVLAPPVNVSITPTSGPISFGSPMTFSSVSSDPNGYDNIKEVRMLLNDSAVTANAIWVKYQPRNGGFWLRNDASTAWIGPWVPGSTLENSQCILNPNMSTVSGSGNNLTITWNITVKSSMSTKQIQSRLATVDYEFNEDTWDVFGTYYTNVSPTNTSLTPSSGGLPTGSEFVLRAVYSDGNGASDCKQCYLLVSDTGAQANSMSLHYDRQANKVRLRADNGSAWSLGYVIGSPGVVLENSQCKLFVERTTVSASGNNLTIDWHVELKAVMAGKKLTGTMSVYDALLTGRADVRGVYFNNLAPVNVSVTPGSGSLTIGSPMTLSTVYRDGNGAVDLYQCMFLLSESGTSVNSVSLFYIKATNKLYLRNDAGTAWLGGYTPGSAGVIENSQCKVYASGSTVSTSGTDLTIGWRVELKPTMTGKNLTGAMTVIDSTSVTVTNVRGIYYTNHAPLNTSVTPNSDSISTGVPTVYTTVYTDADGGGTIRQANFLINTTSGLTNGVLAKYDATANKVYLRNDANTAWSTGYVPGTVMTLENSQCKLYLAGTTATASGSDLTIDLSIELKPTMAAKTLKEYMWVTDAPYAAAGYDLRGTFTTP